MRTAVLSVALAVLLPASGRAQPLTLTEADALARLTADSPRVRALRAPIDIARVDELAATRWPNPLVTVDRESVAGATEHIAMVAQPLPITGRRGLEKDAASALVAASSSRVEDELRRLRANLRLAFADLVAAQVLERELTTARDRLRTLADVLAKREAAGDAAGFDRLRAEREVLDLETDLAQAATERAVAQATLASFLSEVTDPSRLVAVGEAPAPAPLPPLEALIEHAESSRGELQALEREVEAAQFAARAADRRLVPEPEIAAGVKSSSVGGGDLGSVVMVSASIPLFDRARPERALAAARAAQAEAQAAAFRMVLRGRIAALRVAVVERRQAAERFRSEAVRAADQIERIAQVSYEAGERGILELLDAYRVRSTARTRQAALDAAVREAEIELVFASGWELHP